MSRRNSGPKASEQTREQRVEQLRLRLHHEMLKELLLKGKKCVGIYKIEGNSGRQNKAGRDLEQAGEAFFAGYAGESWRGGAHKGYWSATLDRRLEEYSAEASEFGENTVRDHVALFVGHTSRGLYADHEVSLETIGWQSIRHAYMPDLARAWLHKDEYLFMSEKDPDSYRSKPSGKALEWEKCPHPGYFIHKHAHTNLVKLVLRNMVEHYAAAMYDQLSNADTGLKGWSSHSTIEFEVRNVGAYDPHPQNLYMALDDCSRVMEYLRQYQGACERLKAAVEAHGGVKGYHKELLLRSIKGLMTGAPVALATDETDGDKLITKGRIEHIKDVSRYVLAHSDLMEYGRLFDDREGVVRLDNNGSSEDNKLLEPNTDENLLNILSKEVFLGDTKEDTM